MTVASPRLSMMTAGARYRIQMFSAWSGITYMGLLLLGWVVIAGFLPPPSPSANAAQIATIFSHDVTHIRIGMVVLMLGAAFCTPFTAILAQYVTRIEGRPGVLTLSIVIGGVCNIILTFYPAIFWLVAAYRPNRSPDVIYMLNDFAWLQLIGAATIFWPMLLGMAIAALCDGSRTPVFPRWSAYVSLWLFCLVLPDQMIFFFKTGPFAWSGIFGLWMPVAAFGGWFAMTAWLMIRAMKRGIYPDSDAV